MVEKVSWTKFMYDHIETGWVDDDRRKTLRAMRHVWEQMPAADLERIPENTLVFAPSSSKLGQVYPRYNPPVERKGVLIYLSPKLENQSQAEVDTTVAHELAHAILGHLTCNDYELEPSRPLVSQADDPSEIEADKLIVSWGFTPGYKRRQRKGRK